MTPVLKNLILAASLAVALPATAAADPFCAALGEVDQLPKKYQKRGPFYTDASSGWIVGHDQLKSDYAVTAETSALWRDIRAAFEERGVQLVVLAAPPRPLFAPAQMALPETYERDAQQKAFSDYIAALNAAGIVAPDLTEVESQTDAFYFARDTHWTPMGALQAVAALNAAMGGTPAATALEGVMSADSYVEKGSLSTVVEATCGTRPMAETVRATTYVQNGTAADLLGDVTSSARTALVGTSFSDRYQRDAYQVADALAFVMDQSVDNHSVTGGGLIGGMEAFINAGHLAEGGYTTVVWEVPYTTPLTQIDGLRQVLGLLHGPVRAATETQQVALDDTWTNIAHDVSLDAVSVIEIVTPKVDTGQLLVELISEDGVKIRTKLVKSDRVDPGSRTTRWAMATGHLPVNEI